MTGEGGAVGVTGLDKRFGDLVVFGELSLTFQAGKITVLLGPSGSGKTTLLNLLAGTILPDRGSVDGMAGRTVSYIFQEPRLLPWRTVRENLDFVLPRRWSEGERKDRIDHFLSLVGLSGFSGYHPQELSGGMKQRVAIARAFAYPGDVLLMDEPFKGLDLSLRLSLISSFASLWTEDPRTTVYVTHDIQEALLLGDEIVVFSHLPARVVNRLQVDVGRDRRSLENERLLSLEKELYRLFLHSEASC